MVNPFKTPSLTGCHGFFARCSSCAFGTLSARRRTRMPQRYSGTTSIPTSGAKTPSRWAGMGWKGKKDDGRWWKHLETGDSRLLYIKFDVLHILHISHWYNRLCQYVLVTGARPRAFWPCTSDCPSRTWNSRCPSSDFFISIWRISCIPSNTSDESAGNQLYSSGFDTVFLVSTLSTLSTSFHWSMTSSGDGSWTHPSRDWHRGSEHRGLCRLGQHALLLSLGRKFWQKFRGDVMWLAWRGPNFRRSTLCPSKTPYQLRRVLRVAQRCSEYPSGFCNSWYFSLCL